MTTIVRYADHNCCLFVNLINDVHNIYGYTAACRCMTSLLFSYMLILFSWKEIELRNVFILQLTLVYMFYNTQTLSNRLTYYPKF